MPTQTQKSVPTQKPAPTQTPTASKGDNPQPSACYECEPGINEPPYADPGGPYTGQPGQAIQFNGTNSWDADGSVNSYSWNFGDGTTSTGAMPLKTYAAAGTYTVTLRVRDNQLAYSSYSSTTATVSSPTPVNNAAFVSQSVASQMNAGQQYAVSVTMNNSGTKTWTQATQHGLGSQNPQDNGTWLTGRVDVPASIAPGQNATFNFNVTAPSTPGTYNFQWRMLEEGVEWYGGYTPNVSITVTQPVTGSCTGPVPCDGLSTVSYDTASNRINSAGWSYDAAGNQMRSQRADGQWQRYQYDAAGRLLKIKNDLDQAITTYTYGASNRRIVTQDDTTGSRTYYAWEGASVVADYLETAGAPTTPYWSQSYIYLGRRLLATIKRNGGAEGVDYHHPDRLGTRLVSNNTDTSVIEQTTLPFGTALTSESTGETNRRFTSYERSATSNLDYAINRHYDSAQGRFTQVDPLGMSAASLDDPQSLNMYAYCGNDPVNRLDADGLFFGSLFRAFKKALGFVNKIIKWVAIAIIVAVVVAVAIIALNAPGAALAAKFLAFLGGALVKLGIIKSAPMIYSIALVEGGGVTIGLGIVGKIICILQGLGAIIKQLVEQLQKAQNQNCGVNPVTNKPGFTPDPKGTPGNVRPGKGGQGHWHAPRKGGRTHNGLDVSGKIGDPIYANRGGTVTSSGPAGKAGNRIVIDHGGGISTLYGHNTKNLVKLGDVVSQGDIIGTVGQTGNAAGQLASEPTPLRGSKNGVPQNPGDYLNKPCP